MDPIHPITPRLPAIPQVAPAHSDRNARDRREQRRREQERRARERDGRGANHEDSQPPSGDQRSSGDDGPRHIDVRA